MVNNDLAANETKARAQPHQGHGPRADQQAGYIWAISEVVPDSQLRTAADKYIWAKRFEDVPDCQKRRKAACWHCDAATRGKGNNDCPPHRCRPAGAFRPWNAKSPNLRVGSIVLPCPLRTARERKQLLCRFAPLRCFPMKQHRT